MRNSKTRIYLLTAGFFLQTSLLFCQLVSWNFENVTGAIPSIPILPSGTGPGIAGGEGRLSGAQNNGSPTTCASPETWATNFWPTTTTRNTSSYMSFSVTAAEGYRANVTGISFMLSRSSSSAPSEFYVSIFRWGVETFITSGSIPITGCNNFNGSCNISGTSGGALEIRIYLFRQNSAAMAATIRIDNVTISGTTEVALPVSLGDFSGYCNEQNQPGLQWETFSEHHNHGFWVQQSRVNLDFKDLDFIKGQGDSQVRKQYEWHDQTKRRGLNYFRLKQMDYDGRTAYSKIIAVSCENGEIVVSQEDNTTFSVSLGDQTGMYEEWFLYHLDGTKIQTGKIGSMTSIIKITCPNMRTGYYILLLNGKKGSTVRKMNWIE
jgi:hypothetical protein